MSFQDIEAAIERPGQLNSISSQPNGDSTFLSAQSTLSLQVFKINSNVQGILKLVDQLGTARDSATLRKSLCVFVCKSVQLIVLIVWVFWIQARPH